MVNKSSIRVQNEDRYNQCIELRKQGLSYSEIRKVIPVAKSTLQNWLTLAGLTLTREHLRIQLRKRIENRRAGTEASRLTREKKIQKQIQLFLETAQDHMSDSLLIGGCLLYEAEGQKKGECKFSNSDYRLIKYFLTFIEKYFNRSRKDDVIFRLYIHKNRTSDLERILKFWSAKLEIPKGSIKITWKYNIAKVRTNRDYFGQMSVVVRKSVIINRQIKAVSDILLRS